MKKAVLIAIVVTLAGCFHSASIKRDYKLDVKSSFEAAQVTVSALPPVPWEDIAKDLNPNFSLKSAEQLLDKVLRPTAVRVQNSSRAGAIGIGITRPGEIASSNLTTTTNTTINNDGEKNTSTESVLKEENQSGSPSAPTVSVNLPTSNTDNPFSSSNINTDISLAYRLATSVYQEVKILNSYLDQQLVSSDKEAYLMRARINIHPYARSQPMDIYAQLSASLTKQEDKLPKGENNTPGPDGDKSKDNDVTALVSSLSSRFDNEVAVIPLLVTDNLERSDSRKIAQALSSISSNLAFATGGVGIGFDAKKVEEDLRAALGSELNNTFSVGQLSKNQLSVRFGAAFSPESKYEAVTRSYDVSFLLVVPKEMQREDGNNGSRTVTLELLYQVRNALNGTLLPPVSAEELTLFSQEVRESILKNPTDETNSIAMVDTLTDSILSIPYLNRTEYDELAEKVYVNNNFNLPVSIKFWDLSQILFGTTSNIELVSTPPILPASQTAIAVDNGTSTFDVALAGISGIREKNLRGHLIVTNKSNNSTQIFASRSVTIQPEKTLKLDFPSMGAIRKIESENEFTLYLIHEDRYGTCSTPSKPEDENNSVLSEILKLTEKEIRRACQTKEYPVIVNRATSKEATILPSFIVKLIGSAATKSKTDNTIVGRLYLEKAKNAGVETPNSLFITSPNAIIQKVTNVIKNEELPIDATKNRAPLILDVAYDFTIKGLNGNKLLFSIYGENKDGKKIPHEMIALEIPVSD